MKFHCLVILAAALLSTACASGQVKSPDEYIDESVKSAMRISGCPHGVLDAEIDTNVSATVTHNTNPPRHYIPNQGYGYGSYGGYYHREPSTQRVMTVNGTRTNKCAKPPEVIKAQAAAQAASAAKSGENKQ